MRYAFFTVPAAAALIVAMSTASWAKVSAKATTITEHRVKELVKPKADDEGDGGGMMMMMRGMPPGLVVTLRLEGKEIDNATQYGQLKILEAVDDTGASLAPGKEKRGGFGFGGGAAGGEGFTDFPSAAMQDKQPEPVFDVTLKLPSRKATKLAKLRGEVSVKAGGEAKVISVPKVKGMAGKSLQDPALKTAKLKIDVVDPADAEGFAPGGAGTTVALKITGDAGAITSVTVVDATGESVSQGHSSTGFGKSTDYSVFLSKPLDDTMALKVELVVGQKVVKVPFEVKDLQLP